MPKRQLPEARRALTNAERQARVRARRQAEKATPTVRYCRPRDRRSRPQRWHDAVAELLRLQDEYTAWRDALPENPRDSATALALQTIVELDLDDLAAIVPPRGFSQY